MTASTLTKADLLDLYTKSGEQLATIYLPTPSAVEDAAQRLEIRRKNVLAELELLGVSEAILQNTTAALDELDHPDAVSHLLLVGDGDVFLSHGLTRPVSKVAARVGPTPALLPMLEAIQTDEVHLAVLLDRTGADVLLRDGVGDPLDEFDVDGPDVRVHRSAPGGWSQKRFQQTAENAWENNAREVVDQITAEHPDIDLIIGGGDVRALGFFVESLPSRCTVVTVDGSRHADQDAFLDEADVVLRDRAAERVVNAVDEWRTASANGSGTVGADVVDHLTQGRVDTLLVVNDTFDVDRPMSTLDFGSGMQSRDAIEAPMTDAAVALAHTTGASVLVVPNLPDLDKGLAATLRF